MNLLTWVKQDTIDPRKLTFELNQEYELTGDHTLRVEVTSETYPTKSPVVFEIDITVQSPCQNASVIDPIANKNHQVGTADKLVSLSSVISPIECEPEIVYTMTSSPVSPLISIDDSSRTITIASTSDPSEAGTFTVTVTATITTGLQDTETFDVTIFDCSTLTIDTTKFTTPALTYIVGTA